jgi:hemoglobin
MALRDIESRADLEELVRAFYTQAFADPVIGPLFTDVAQLDLEAHVPQITAFWETILLGADTYSGGVFNRHAELHVKAELREVHFDHWLRLWFGTVDERFAGERANQAKLHALRVAQAFLGRLQGIPGGGAAT